MLVAILDFSARHHLCQFMPAVSKTIENEEHFGIWHILLYAGGGGGGVRVHNFSVLKVILPINRASLNAVFLVFLFKGSLDFFVILIKPVFVFARHWS